MLTHQGHYSKQINGSDPVLPHPWAQLQVLHHSSNTKTNMSEIHD